MEIQFAIIMAGLPGSGKSTLAKELSKKLKIPLIDLDHLKPVSIEDTFKQGWIAYDSLFKVLECQLQSKLNLIVDTCLTYSWIQEKILSYTKKYKVIPIILLCYCSDEIAQSRIKERLEKGEQLDCSLKKYERLKSIFHINHEICDLVLDTEVSISENLDQVIEYLKNLLPMLEKNDIQLSLIQKIIENKLSNVTKKSKEYDVFALEYNNLIFNFDQIYRDTIKIEIPKGDLIDKFTILLIKLNKIEDQAKQLNIRKEYFSLLGSVNYLRQKYDLDELGLIDKLLEINSSLWNIEDKIREKEYHQKFDQEFIQLARSVYFLNDQRSEIKRKINLLTNSNLIEEKEYF